MTGKTFILASIAAIAIAAAAPAEARDFRFTYSAYELQTEGGREAVLKRLDRRAARYCGDYARKSLSDKRLAESCRQQVTREVVDQIDNPRLTAMYENNIALAQK